MFTCKLRIVAGIPFAAICMGLAISKSTCPLPLDLNPVCGSDGRTYENICMLDLARSQEPNLDMLSQGPCDDNTGDEEEDLDLENTDLPSCDCPRGINPVCGSDGNTYDNVCLLNCAQSNNPSLEIGKDGACEESEKKALKSDQGCDCRLKKEQVGDDFGMVKSLTCCGPVLFPKD